MSGSSRGSDRSQEGRESSLSPPPRRDHRVQPRRRGLTRSEDSRRPVSFAEDKENVRSINSTGEAIYLSGLKGRAQLRSSLELDDSSMNDIPLPEKRSLKQDAGRTPFRYSYPGSDISQQSVAEETLQEHRFQRLDSRQQERPRSSAGLSSGAKRVSLAVHAIQADTMDRVYEDVERYITDHSTEIELSPIPRGGFSPTKPKGGRSISAADLLQGAADSLEVDSSTSSDETFPEEFASVPQTRESLAEDSLCLEELLGFNVPPFKVFESEEEPMFIPAKEELCRDKRLNSSSEGEDICTESPVEESLRWSEETMMTAALTTLTVVPAMDSALKTDLPPRVNIVSKTRRRQDFEDVKELVLQTEVQKSTSATLTFGNNRGTELKIRAEAVLLHCDAVSQGDNEFIASTQAVFSVRPTILSLSPGEEGTLHVSFSPGKGAIYSGLLKIKCNRRFFTFFLRGECSERAPQICDNEVPALDNESHDTLLIDEEISITSTAQRRNNFIQDWLTRSRTHFNRPLERDVNIDSGAFSFYPSKPEFESTLVDGVYRANIQLRNHLQIPLRVCLRSPFMGISFDQREADIPAFGSIT